MPAYKMLSVEEAAVILGLTPVRVRQFCQEGRLGKRLGRQWIILKSELDLFRKQERRPGRPSSDSATPAVAMTSENLAENPKTPL